MTDKTKQKAEAVARMKAMGVIPEYIRQFQDEGKVSISEPPLGALYWAEGEQLAAIRAFEEEHDAIVYMVVRCYSTIGKMDSYLYVSAHEDEWPDDRLDIDEGVVFTYTVNYDAPDCSEFGSIAFRMAPGGAPVRVG